MLSLPWSPLASMPPEVDVPLSFRLGVMELPVVGDELGLAELAAGSSVVEPEPLGAPLCAYAKEAQSVSAAASAIGERERRVPPLFHGDSAAKSTAFVSSMVFAKSLNPPAIGFHCAHCKATPHE
jgi:hypothetical protein